MPHSAVSHSGVPKPGRRCPARKHRDVVDCVVIGGGVVGAAAAWQLARRGQDVVLVEQFDAGHTRGASHGSSRIYRQTYASTPYVELAGEALRLWRELETETGASVLQMTGGIDHGDQELVAELALSLARHGIDHRWLGSDEAMARWPGMVFDGPVLYQSDRSGRINADQAVAALTAAAVGRGADVRHRTRVSAVTVCGPDLVEVETSAGSVRARRAVVAVGAWTEALVGGLVELPPLRVTQEQPAHFPVLGAGPCTPLRHVGWPTFIHHAGPEQGWPSGVYGLATEEGCVKVGFHGVGPLCHPDRRSFEPQPAQLRRLQDYVATFLPGLDHQRPEPISCTYTSTPDANFVLRSQGPVAVGAGFSGHGFKFAPALGRVLADLSAGVIDEQPLVPTG
ncbi:FAD-dependent oxidoreductase [Pseudonocardia sp. GCM10023141]|uniref:FAD-dependent oxidoreductase n=1 Tax=Pseudonocardia sp. GCM10023141 TaxID=3252653 RepID=UPI003622344A